ncbi:hypothetical protein NE237_010954 [Protea cynaroides]|uniref:Pectinesterase catalytic domain-containing protein n=1 Tax=Protea cynaroides TaxID=273540 RepID=A0A9Q0R224_9MAGN|nr:hypothetical protein NE237_010954 [Protea cynaroides]
MSTFYLCSFEGYPDTLYTHSLRQFYGECDIYGMVDFIFGNAVVVFQNCNIYARLPIQGQSDTLTAQGRTDPNQNTGTSIQDCNIEASLELLLSNFTAEFNNTGLGSPTIARVNWPGYHVINATDATNFTVSNFIRGDYWLPATGVPYQGGLFI